MEPHAEVRRRISALCADTGGQWRDREVPWTSASEPIQAIGIIGWNSAAGIRPFTFALLQQKGGVTMNGLIYLVGLIVIILAILSFLGLR